MVLTTDTWKKVATAAKRITQYPVGSIAIGVIISRDKTIQIKPLCLKKARIVDINNTPVSRVGIM